MKVVGIQGGPASFHEQAAQQLYGKDVKIAYYDTFADVFAALRTKGVSSIVVALANNRFQFIPGSLNPLVQPNSPYTITAETYVRVEHALLGLPGTRVSDIVAVHSQAPALGQCEQFLESVSSHARAVEEQDTSGSAELVANMGDPTHAAIASAKAGELYGLEVIAAGIQDDEDNITRFLEVKLATYQEDSPLHNKTSVLLHIPNQPGSLRRALEPFDTAGISLSSLQSRYAPNTHFDLHFFVEFEAGLQEPQSQKVLVELAALKGAGYGVETLGSYVAADIPPKQQTNT